MKGLSTEKKVKTQQSTKIMKEWLVNEQMSGWEGGAGAVEGAVASLTPLSSLCVYL